MGVRLRVPWDFEGFSNDCETFFLRRFGTDEAGLGESQVDASEVVPADEAML